MATVSLLRNKDGKNTRYKAPPGTGCKCCEEVCPCNDPDSTQPKYQIVARWDVCGGSPTKDLSPYKQSNWSCGRWKLQEVSSEDGISRNCEEPSGSPRNPNFDSNGCPDGYLYPSGGYLSGGISPEGELVGMPPAWSPPNYPYWGHMMLYLTCC